MIEQDLEKIKNRYQNTELPQYLIYNGWADLKFKLPEQKNNFLRLFIGRGLIFASICLILTVGVLTSAQAAKPGDLLFPIKDFTQNVKAKITGNYEEIVENRAKDVIDLSTKSQDKVDEAIRKYKQSVRDSQENTKDPEKSEELEKTIENRDSKIREIEQRDRGNSDRTDEEKSVQGIKNSSEHKNPNGEEKQEEKDDD